MWTTEPSHEQVKRYRRQLRLLWRIAPLRWALDDKDVAAKVVAGWDSWRTKFFEGWKLDDLLEQVFAHARCIQESEEEPRLQPMTGQRVWSEVRSTYRFADAACALAEAFELRKRHDECVALVDLAMDLRRTRDSTRRRLEALQARVTSRGVVRLVEPDGTLKEPVRKILRGLRTNPGTSWEKLGLDIDKSRSAGWIRQWSTPLQECGWVRSQKGEVGPWELTEQGARVLDDDERERTVS